MQSRYVSIILKYACTGKQDYNAATARMGRASYRPTAD